ncbi:MAG: nitrile hydratase subunit beta [Rhodovarius sp.]|nr:nitrile hydratase subunit beta [Rhodovarius sp.]
MTPRFAPGQRVRVRPVWPEALGRLHLRTPHYLRGRTGVIDRCLGRFPNPEDLAFRRPAAERDLYHVLFDQRAIWPEAAPGDTLLVEIFEHWLEAADAQA